MPFWFLVRSIIGMLPSMDSTANTSFDGILGVIGYGCAFIGTDFFLAFLGNITFWLTIQMLWVVIEWVYKKFPGVN